jgi:hypothetical protein
MLHPKDFVPSLVEKLNVPKEKAQAIAKEVNQKIFSPVKDLLIELYKLEKNEKTEVEEQKQEFLPKKESAEIGVPKKPEQQQPSKLKNFLFRKPQKQNLPLPPIKKEVAETKTPTPPTSQVPQKKQEEEKSPLIEKPSFKPTVSLPPIPQVPQKKSEEEKSFLIDKKPLEIKIPTPTLSVPQKQVIKNEIPVPKKQENLPPKPSLGIKNPFEEKLRQTFTIPSKEIPKESLQKKNSEDEIEREKKKEAITKDPYLETPE